MRVSSLKELKVELTQQQTYFTKIQKGNVASDKASCEFNRMIAIRGKSYSEGNFVNQCLIKTVEIACWEKAHLFKVISLFSNTVSEQIDEILFETTDEGCTTQIWTFFCCYCNGRENFVFRFGAQFNSTLNFTQSGWPILFTPDLLFRAANWASCQTQSLWLENAVQCKRHTGRTSIAIASRFSWTTLPSADVSLRL